MRKYRVLYILLIIGAIGFSMGYKSSLTTVLLYMVLLMPVLSLLLLIVSRLAIRIETSPKRIVVHKEQMFVTSVYVRNNFIVPLAPVRITGIFQDNGAMPKTNQIVVSISPFNKIEVSFNGAVRYRGEYMIGVQSVEIVDLLKLFRFTVKREPQLETIVIPRRLTPLSNSQDDSDSESVKTSLSFFENNTFSSVRKYREGDNMRHVHWKLSAKQDELVVRQMEQNINSSALIFFDLNAYGDTVVENTAALDAILETVLALTRLIISEGNTALEIFTDPEKNTPECLGVTGNEEYEMLYGMCAVIPSADGSTPFVNTLDCYNELLGSTSSVYIITARADDDVIAQATQLGTITNNPVKLLLIKNEMNVRHADALATNYSIRTHLLDENNLLASINSALDFNV